MYQYFDNLLDCLLPHLDVYPMAKVSLNEFRPSSLFSSGSVRDGK
jgi:hypothetical protein